LEEFKYVKWNHLLQERQKNYTGFAEKFCVLKELERFSTRLRLDVMFPMTHMFYYIYSMLIISDLRKIEGRN
jgi:hypothetical protein